MAGGKSRNRRVRPASRGTLIESVLDTLTTGVVLLDRHAGVVFANTEALRLSEVGDTFRLEPEGLVALSKPEAIELTAIVSAVVSPPASASPAGGSMRFRRAPGRFPLAVVVRPLRCQTASRGAVVFIRDPDVSGLDFLDMVRAVFDLSPAEARVAVACTEGHRPEEIAERLGLTSNTVRWYLKQAYAKLGVTGQAQLVRVLLQLPQVGPAPVLTAGRRI